MVEQEIDIQFYFQLMPNTAARAVADKQLSRPSKLRYTHK